MAALFQPRFFLSNGRRTVSGVSAWINGPSPNSRRQMTSSVANKGFPPTPRFMTTTSFDPLCPVAEEKMPLYAMGLNIGMQVGGQGNFQTLLDEEELEIVLEGFCDQMRGSVLQEDARAILTKFGPALNAMLVKRTDSLLDRVKKNGEEFVENFLDCNPEAIKTESGLVYYSMKEGDGKQPTLANTVEVHYHGTLIDGTVFDSSVDRGQTISFPLSNVIKGWQEGLAMMKEGGKATLVIPSDLAYGDNGSGDVIPPGCTLKFEVELYKVA